MIRFWTEDGITDKMTNSLARKAIECGIIDQTDQISVDDGEWKPCSKIKDVEWKPCSQIKAHDWGTDGVEPTPVDWVECGEDVFEQLVRKFGNNFSEMIKYIREDPIDLAGFLGATFTLDRRQIRFEIWNSTENVSLKFSYYDGEGKECRFSKCTFKTCNEDSYYGKDIIPCYSHSQDKRELTVEILKERFNRGISNELSFEAIDFNSGSRYISYFSLKSSILNRILRSTITRNQADYDFEDFLKTNEDTVFVNYDVHEHHDHLTNRDINIVYILTNNDMPGIVKIGKTSQGVAKRMEQLNSTGVPSSFHCYYAAYVEDMDKTESDLHDCLAEYRVSGNREFFRIDPREVHKVLSEFALGDATFS